MKSRSIVVPTWYGSSFWLSSKGLIEKNPGPCDYSKIKGVKLMHLNTNRAVSKLDSILEFTSKFSSKSIVGFTESALTKTCPDARIRCPDMNLLRFDNEVRPSLGILIYHTKDLKCVSFKKFGNDDFSFVMCEFACGTDHLYFGILYRLPDASHRFFENFESILESYCHSDRQVVIMGDVNIDLLKNDNLATKWSELLQNFQLSQCIVSPTRVAKRLLNITETLIDHIIVSESVTIDNIVNHEAHLSDHHLIGCRIKSFGFKFKAAPRPMNCRLHAPGIGVNFKLTDYPALLQNLSVADWSSVYSLTSVSDKWDALYENLLSEIYKICPRYACKCGKVAPDEKHSEPWFNDALGELRKQRDIAYKVFFRCKTPENHEIYRLLRNHFNSAKSKERAAYYTAQIYRASSFKEKWTVVNKLRGLDVNKSTSIDNLVVDGVFIKEPTEIRNNMNGYFSTIGVNTYKEVTDQACLEQVQQFIFPEVAPSDSFSFIPPDYTEVYKAISTLKDLKPGGPSGLPPEFIKAIFPAVGFHLTHVFQHCILQSTVPDAWKIGHVTPVYKKGLRSERGNYRPITVTDCISKTFERLLMWQIERHLLDHNVLSKTQFGFRKFHSTTHALIDSIDSALIHLNSSKDKFVSFVYLDLSKAFDIVPTDRLVSALSAAGFDLRSTNLMESFLRDRSQMVKMAGGLSSSLPVNSGVPQGSLLGPILFALFVNNMASVLENDHTKCTQYADDSCILTKAESVEELLQRTEHNLLAAKRFFLSLGLKINLDKTQYLPMTNSHNLRQLIRIVPLFVNHQSESVIVPQRHATNLGLLVDDELNFNAHKTQLLSKLKSALFMIRSIRYKITQEAAKDLYNTLFLASHDYASIIFDTSTHGTKYINDQLEVVHRSVLRSVHKKLHPMISHETNAQLYSSTGAISLENRRKMLTASLVYSCLDDNIPVPESISGLIHISETNDRAIAHRRLTVPHTVHRTDMYKNSFSFRAVRCWNDIDVDVRWADSKQMFKNAFKERIRAT